MVTGTQGCVTALKASLVDMVYTARLIPGDEADLKFDESTQPIANKLRISPNTLPVIRKAYDLHSQ